MNKEEQLVRAAYADNIKTVKMLLNEGVNPNSADNNGQTALYFAARHGCTEIVKALLAVGADVNKPAGWQKRTPLFVSAIGFQYETAKVLIDAGGNINQFDGDGIAPLHYVVSGGRDTGLPVRTETVKKFIEELHPDVNQKTQWGVSPLQCASLCGHSNIVKILLEHGADVNYADTAGNTALHRAVKNEDIQTVGILLEAGADVNCANKHGETPLHTAVFDENVQCITALLNAGADINKTDNDGKTPLRVAAGRNLKMGAALLLAAGADKTITDKNGQTALDVAKQCKHADIVCLLNNMIVRPTSVKVTGHTQTVNHQKIKKGERYKND